MSSRAGLRCANSIGLKGRNCALASLYPNEEVSRKMVFPYPFSTGPEPLPAANHCHCQKGDPSPHYPHMKCAKPGNQGLE